MARKRCITKRKKTQKRKPYKGKGGFYPSVAGGIGNAIYLTPLAIRAGIKLFTNKGNRRKTRKNIK